MTLHIHYKKIIAREILIFFSAVILILLIWGVFFLRNSYYKFQEEENKDKLTSLTSELDSLPRDEIKALYDGINQDFVVKYISLNLWCWM